MFLLLNPFQRSRRLFGSLLGTLQKFRQDENKIKDRELKKREIELKIEEKTEKEKDEAKKKKQELFHEREKQKQELRTLQVFQINTITQLQKKILLLSML